MTTVGRPVQSRLDMRDRARSGATTQTSFAGGALAVLRISTGFVFFWAFLDKTFGLGFATTSSKAWIHGGSPTEGFLSSVGVGPLESFYHAIAGDWWADWLFMLGMLAVGLALMLGIGLRLSAAAGGLLLVMMWFAEFPADRFTSAGVASASSNPVVDYHFSYVVVVVVLAATYAGNTWGLGRLWASLPIIDKNRWLL